MESVDSFFTQNSGTASRYGLHAFFLASASHNPLPGPAPTCGRPGASAISPPRVDVEIISSDTRERWSTLIERAGRALGGASGAHTDTELICVLISMGAGLRRLYAAPASIPKTLETARLEASRWRPPPQPGLHSGTAPWGPGFWG